MNNEDRKADLEPFIESIRGNGNDSAEYMGAEQGLFKILR